VYLLTIVRLSAVRLQSILAERFTALQRAVVDGARRYRLLHLHSPPCAESDSIVAHCVLRNGSCRVQLRIRSDVGDRRCSVAFKQGSSRSFRHCVGRRPT